MLDRSVESLPGGRRWRGPNAVPAPGTRDLDVPAHLAARSGALIAA